MADFGLPVKVGGLWIRPGDLLHGDQHGVVVVPPEIAEKIPEAAARIEARERKMIAVCRKPGVTVEDLKAARTAMRQSVLSHDDRRNDRGTAPVTVPGAELLRDGQHLLRARPRRSPTIRRGLLEQIKVCNSVYAFQFPVRTAGRLRSHRRLARPAQPPPLPVKGGIRYARRGRRGRGQGAGGAHDLQVRHRRRAVRRRQGRRPDRHQAVHGPRRWSSITRRYTAELIKKNFIGAGPRRAGARLRHRLPRDGVDLRYLLGVLSRRRSTRWPA